jgi:hypothetical protein
MTTTHEFLDHNEYFSEPQPPLNVFTYFDQDPSLPDFSGVVECWRASWAQHGWEPAVLGRDQVTSHPLFPHLARHVLRLPSVNPPLYEVSCYMRWAALDTMHGGLMVDFDVMNFGFRPLDLCASYPLLFLHPGIVPCAVFCPAPQRILDMILAYRPEEAITAHGKPHCSDQEMFRLPHNRSQISVQPECVEYRDLFWTTSPLVHFSTTNCALGGETKEQAVFRVCRERGLV